MGWPAGYWRSWCPCWLLWPRTGPLWCWQTLCWGSSRCALELVPFNYFQHICTHAGMTEGVGPCPQLQRCVCYVSSQHGHNGGNAPPSFRLFQRSSQTLCPALCWAIRPIYSSLKPPPPEPTWSCLSAQLDSFDAACLCHCQRPTLPYQLCFDLRVSAGVKIVVTSSTIPKYFWGGVA